MACVDMLRYKKDGLVTVKMSYFINQIPAISDADQKFMVDMYVESRWDDDRLQSLSEEECLQGLREGKIWWPDVELIDGLECNKESEHFYITGASVIHWYRVKAWVSSSMDLRLFPCDFQTLRIRFESSSHDANELQLVSDVDGTVRCGKLLRTMHMLGEWRLHHVNHHASDYKWEYDNISYPYLQIDVVVVRQTGYYINRIGLTVALIWLMSFSVYLCDADDIGNRLQVSITLALTAVAFQFVALESLPRVPYMTLLDTYMSICFGTIASSVLETCVVFRAHESEHWSDTDVAAIENFSLWANVFCFLAVSGWLLSKTRISARDLPVEEVFAHKYHSYGSVVN